MADGKTMEVFGWLVVKPWRMEMFRRLVGIYGGGVWTADG